MEDQKRRQIDYHEREHYRALSPRIVDNSHPCVAWLNTYRLREAVAMMGVSLAGKNVLSLCGGDGQEGEFFQRQGAAVTVTDLSSVALGAAQVRNPALHCVRMDAESLSFADESFDWVIVRDGLHHLARPFMGFYEAERVCRDGFIILEGQDSLPVRFLSAIGIAESWDPAGGYVYRFSRREIRKIFSAMQTVSEWQVRTAWLPFGSDILNLFPAFSRWVYPAIKRPAIERLLTTAPARKTLKSGFRLLTAIGGHWGNSLIIVAHKKRSSTPRAM